MKKLLTRGLMGLAAVAVPAGALMALPMAAHASPSSVKAVTHASHHEDTTSVSGPGTIADPTYGPVWAYDNLSIQFSAAQDTATTYTVTITTHGSFDAIANPLTGEAYTGHGSVDGTITYDVASSTPPDAKNLPAQESDTAHLGTMLDQLFGQHVSPTGGSYNYSYNQIPGAPGGVYTQNG